MCSFQTRTLAILLTAVGVLALYIYRQLLFISARAVISFLWLGICVQSTFECACTLMCIFHY